MRSISGRSSRSTFTATKCRFRSAATSSFSKDSCSMTWHQWHVEYPTERNTGLSSRLAFSNASSPHGYQSTGLLACCSKYGLFSAARRFGILQCNESIQTTSEEIRISQFKIQEKSRLGTDYSILSH